jgi:5'-nucleotidase
LTEKALRILITNDDGVDAPGLQVMRDIARQLSDDLWVVAPDGNQSGAGHGFSFGRELAFDQRDDRTFAIVGGTPADCVAIGCSHILADHRPDIVLSGVNAGQNLGDIIHCSGTAAGAREGALQGAIGIALSQGTDYRQNHDVVWDNSVRYGADLVRDLIAATKAAPDGSRNTFYNVNFPFCAPDDVSGVRVVPHQRFARSPFGYFASDNAGKFFIAIPGTPLPLDPESDFHLLHESQAITVTPLVLQQTDMALAKSLDGRLGIASRR